MSFEESTAASAIQKIAEGIALRADYRRKGRIVSVRVYPHQEVIYLWAKTPLDLKTIRVYIETSYGAQIELPPEELSHPNIPEEFFKRLYFSAARTFACAIARSFPEAHKDVASRMLEKSASCLEESLGLPRVCVGVVG